jgi:hypothetical protein
MPQVRGKGLAMIQKLGPPGDDHLDWFAISRMAAEWSFKVAGWLILLGTLKFAHQKSGVSLFEWIYSFLSVLPGFIVYCAIGRITHIASPSVLRRFLMILVAVIGGLAVWVVTVALVNYSAHAIASFQASLK